MQWFLLNMAGYLVGIGGLGALGFVIWQVAQQPNLWNRVAGLDPFGILVEIVILAVPFLFSWYLFRRARLRALDRFTKGESDVILFQAHHLLPAESDSDPEAITLVFRTLAHQATVSSLFVNPAARDAVMRLQRRTTPSRPMLALEGQEGLVILNRAINYLCGDIALSSARRQVWLFVMTAEDPKQQRRVLGFERCIRCFLIRQEDLELFHDAAFCESKVRVEHPAHAVRIATLHLIAKHWIEIEKQGRLCSDGATRVASTIPDSKTKTVFPWIRKLSVGICEDEVVAEGPHKANWDEDVLRDRLQKMKVDWS